MAILLMNSLSIILKTTLLVFSFFTSEFNCFSLGCASLKTVKLLGNDEVGCMLGEEKRKGKNYIVCSCGRGSVKCIGGMFCSYNVIHRYYEKQIDKASDKL